MISEEHGNRDWVEQKIIVAFASTILRNISKSYKILVTYARLHVSKNSADVYDILAIYLSLFARLFLGDPRYIYRYIDSKAQIYNISIAFSRLQYSLLYYYLAEPIFTFDTKRYKWRELLERLFEVEIFGVTLRSAEGFIEFCLAIL